MENPRRDDTTLYTWRGIPRRTGPREEAGWWPDVTSRRLLGSAVAVLLLATVLALLPAASAGTPQPLGFNPDNLESPATDVGIDDTGRFAGAVIQTSSTDNDPLGPSGRDNLYVYRITDETFHASYSQENLTSTTFSQMVAVPSSDSGGAQRFAVAGPDGRILVFDRTESQDANPVNHRQFEEHRASDIDISGDGEWIAIAFRDIDNTRSGRITTLRPLDGGGYDRNFVELDSRPTASAISPQGEGDDVVVAVGTARNGVVFYFGPDVQEAQRFSRSLNENEVSDIDLSGDGEYVAVGTESEAGGGTGSLYFLGRDSSAGTFDDSYTQYVSRFNDPRASVDEVAITEDGQYIAAGTDDGRIRFFENQHPDDPNRHSARIGSTWEHPSGASVDDLEVSNDGRYFVAAVGGSMWGFTRDTGEVLWVVRDVQGSVDQVDVSGDGSRFVAVTNDGSGDGRVYGWRHQEDLDIEADVPEPTIKPHETRDVNVSVTNEGSNVDSFSIVVSGPSGWQISPGIVESEILPGRTENFTLSLSPTENEHPGIYPTSIRATSQVTGERVAEGFVNTTVPKVNFINITTENASVQVDAGAQRVVPFEVDNRGNDRAFINVSDIRQSHSTGEAWDVEVQEWEIDEPIQIDRGGSTTLTLSIRPPASAVDGDYSRIEVFLDAGGDGGSDPATNLALDTFNVTARVNPTFDFQASLQHQVLEIKPDEFRQVELIVENRGNSLDIIRINKSVTPQDVSDHWDVEIPLEKQNLTLGPGQVKSVPVTVRPDAGDPEPATVRLELDSEGAPRQVLTMEVRQPPDDDDDGFLGVPTPGPAAAALAVTLAAVARRTMSPGRPRER